MLTLVCASLSAKCQCRLKGYQRAGGRICYHSVLSMTSDGIQTDLLWSDKPAGRHVSLVDCDPDTERIGENIMLACIFSISIFFVFFP